MRDLDQNSSAVPGLGIASAGATMCQINQHLNALADDLVTLPTANIRDESDAACIVLVGRIVQALRGRQTVLCGL